MDKSTLNEILNDKDESLRVSIIVSTELKSFADKEKIQLKFKNIINQVTKELQGKYNKEKVNSVVNSIKLLLKQVNLEHLQNGIGIYASPNFVKQVYFPFPVKDKVLINRYFEVSDVIETLNKLLSYSVLLLSKNKTRLLIGKGNVLSEINDENFPHHYENEYEINRTQSNSMIKNSIEVSQINHIRVEDYFRKIDKLIKNYAKNEAIVVLGVTEHISTFKKVSKHKNFIIASIEGNFDKCTPHIINQLVWPEIENYCKKRKVLQSDRF